MLNPGDNRGIGCFVKERLLDNDFKVALYPRWCEASSFLVDEVAKTKELYFKLTNEPRVRQRIDAAPLKLVGLHYDLAQATDKLVNEMKRVAEQYATEVERSLINFANELDTRGGIAGRIESVCKPYVKVAADERKEIFEAFQKNLIDGLLWEHTTRDNRRVEEAQPSVGNSTNHDTQEETTNQEDKKLDWDEYRQMHFASVKSNVEQRNQDRIGTENPEDDQVRSVN